MRRTAQVADRTCRVAGQNTPNTIGAAPLGTAPNFIAMVSYPDD